MESPHIITVTDLRRCASGIIDGPVAIDVPVFITQRGHVVAVVVSRALFDRLARAERSARTPASPSDEPNQVSTTGKAGIESFGPLPRGTLFETPWNLVDSETAAFLMEDGIPVRPYLDEWIEKGPLETWVKDGDGS
jgi:prevent-host-death family protein